MQLYSDVLGTEIKIVKSVQAGAKGSAIFAAYAGVYFGSVNEAALVIADKCEKIYYHNSKNMKFCITNI